MPMKHTSNHLFHCHGSRFIVYLVSPTCAQDQPARPPVLILKVALAISGKVRPWLQLNVEGNSPTTRTVVFWHWHKDDALATCT